jgi:hypothetical protein
MKSSIYNFNVIWEECLQYNIEQKPEEFKMLMDTLAEMPNRRYALEIGSNCGGFVAGLCNLFENVITLDIKHDENFDKIKSKHPNYSYIIGDSTSNDTLERLKRIGIKFDFIFIDGDHSYDGVKNDYLKYKQLLSPTGHLGFHDILHNPMSNFGVDKFWGEIKDTYAEHKEFVCTERSNAYRTDNLFHQIVKNSPYGSWGGIGLLKNSPVAVFSHNYLRNHWKDVVNEQLELLFTSGLYSRADKILYGVFSDTDESYYEFTKMVEHVDVDVKIEIVRYEKNVFEYPTLIHLQTYCQIVPNAVVLYYHSKSTSRPSEDINLHSWRRCLEYFNIELWKKSVKNLITDTHDVCGALYVEYFAFLNYVFKNYYSGNFWWASAKYINTLPNLSLIVSSPEINRTEAEMWIGKSSHRWASYYSENVTEWYNHYFDPSVYRKIT